LHEDAVHPLVTIERVDQLQDLALIRARRQVMRERLDPALQRGAALVAHVHAGGGILAHLHDGKPRAAAVPGCELRRALRHLGAHLGGDRLAIEQDGAHQ
jgi:hypothetical protein